MIYIIEILVLIVIAISSLFILLYPLHAFIARSKNRHLRRLRNYEGSLSIIIPVKGLDVGALDNFQTYFLQILNNEYEIIFCIEEESDPAVRVIREVCELNNNVTSKIIFSGKNVRYEGKMHNLTEALKHACGSVVVFIDSDVRLINQNYISDFIKPLVEDEVGLITCFQACYGARTIGAGLISIMSNADLMGYFVSLYSWGKLDLANGAVLAIRKDVLDSIGGLSDLRNKVLNDAALARKIVNIDKEIILADSPARIYSGDAKIGDWWHQASRWHIAIKSFVKPIEYLLFGITRLGLFFAVIYFLFTPISQLSALVLAIPVLSRTLSLALINGIFIRDMSTWKYFWLIYIIDLCNVIFLIKPFFTRRILWRGRRYIVLDNADTIPDS